MDLDLLPRWPPGSRLLLALSSIFALGACSRERPGPVTQGVEPGAAAPAAVEAPSAPPANDSPDAHDARRAMVEGIRRRGTVTDGRALDALSRVPRHLFVAASIETAYLDRPLPIGHGQTISQPTIVAMMTAALELTGGEKVLEIGTGSGYQAAVLSLLAARVYSIELLEPLGMSARARLERLGYRNVVVRVGDGYLGWPEEAPFDRVIVTAAPPELPAALIDQLKVGGVLVAPVGERFAQKLVRVRKLADRTTREVLEDVAFVPMVPGR